MLTEIFFLDSMDQETVAFCVQHESMQKTNNATLKFDSVQFVTHTSVNMQNGTFTAPKSGRKSLFSSSERGKPLFWFWSKPKPYFNWFRETKTETKTH